MWVLGGAAAAALGSQHLLWNYLNPYTTTPGSWGPGESEDPYGANSPDPYISSEDYRRDNPQEFAEFDAEYNEELVLDAEGLGDVDMDEEGEGCMAELEVRIMGIICITRV